MLQPYKRMILVQEIYEQSGMKAMQKWYRYGGFEEQIVDKLERYMVTNKFYEDEEREFKNQLKSNGQIYGILQMTIDCFYVRKYK